MATELLRAFFKSGMEADIPSPIMREQFFRVVPYEIWKNLPPEIQVKHEQAAIINMMQKKRDPGYVTAIGQLAQGVPDLSPETQVGIIVPTYNEHDTISTLLETVATQRTSADTKKWSLLFVLNHPDTDTDTEDDPQEEQQLQQTADRIDGFIKDNPDMQVAYVIARPPIALANRGLARMVGHDVMMKRSLFRGKLQEKPFFIQTLDADTLLHPEFMSTVVEAADASRGQTIIREQGEFSIGDKIHHPALNLIEVLENQTAYAISENTDNPWTSGRGTLVEAYAHAQAGGIFGKKMPTPDEDIRMGIDIIHLRPEDNAKRQITTPLFTSNAESEINAIARVKQLITMYPGQFTREMQRIATTMYGIDRAAEDEHPITDTTWLDTQEAFEHALPTREVEVFLNAWWHKVRTEYSLYYLKQTVPPVKRLYAKFHQGKIDYTRLHRDFNMLEHELYQHNPSTDFIEGIKYARFLATLDLEGIAKKSGIEIIIGDIPIEPAGMSPQTELAEPLQVTSTRDFREQLREKLLI